eukprot:767138-Hanusia_phi.AAC.3
MSGREAKSQQQGKFSTFPHRRRQGVCVVCREGLRLDGGREFSAPLASRNIQPWPSSAIETGHQDLPRIFPDLLCLCSILSGLDRNHLLLKLPETLGKRDEVQDANSVLMLRSSVEHRLRERDNSRKKKSHQRVMFSPLEISEDFLHVPQSYLHRLDVGAVRLKDAMSIQQG